MENNFKDILTRQCELERCIELLFFNPVLDWYNASLILKKSNTVPILRKEREWKKIVENIDIIEDEKKEIHLKEQVNAKHFFIPHLNAKNEIKIQMKIDEKIYEISDFDNVSISKFSEKKNELSKLFQVVCSIQEEDQWLSFKQRYGVKIGFIECLIKEFLQITLNEKTYLKQHSFFENILFKLMDMTNQFNKEQFNKEQEEKKEEQSKEKEYGYQVDGETLKTFILLIDLLRLFPSFIEMVYDEEKERIRKVDFFRQQNALVAIEQLKLQKLKEMTKKEYFLNQLSNKQS